MATITIPGLSPKLRATIYRFLAAFGLVFVAAFELQTSHTQVRNTADVWHAAVAALPFAIEKFMATNTNAEAHAAAVEPPSAPGTGVPPTA